MNAARALALGLCLASAWATPITLEQSEDVPSIHEREIATLCVNLRDESEYVLVPGHGLLCPPNMLRAATGAYADTIHGIGWGQFEVETAPDAFTDVMRAFAAGYVEGHLTAHRITQQIKNYRLNVFKNSSEAVPPPQTRAFLEEQLKYARNESAARVAEFDFERMPKRFRDGVVSEEELNGNEKNRRMDDMGVEEKYWRTVQVIVAQFDGIVQGYSRAENVPKSEAEDGLSWINSNNEIDELMGVFNETNWTDDKKTNLEASMLSCSALIRVLPGNADVLMGHDTWRGYFGMLRIFKYYKLSLSYTTSVVGFSSAAGTTSSHDDFYMTNHKLAIAETTNSQYNKTWVKENTRPQSLVTWQRANIANMLATSGREWADLFAKQNSGLYPNQWMIVDYNLFTPGMEMLPNWLLTISEQLPDRCVTGDGTSRLRTEGFWPSYNIPYFPEVYNASLYPNEVAKRGEDFAYSTAPRAKIFNRDAPKVMTIEGMKHILRYNKWQTDPLSKGDAHNSISGRYDLASEPKAYGGVDGKITGAYMIGTLSAIAQSGPTYENQEPFSWSKSNYSTSVHHHGLPDTYRFPWVHFEAPAHF